MKKSFVTILAPVLVGALGVAAIIFGETDDAPGLVLFGLLIIGGALAFGLSPALRTKSRVIGLTVAVVAIAVIGSVTAGWLENQF